jgi:hypothetical protein
MAITSNAISVVQIPTNGNEWDVFLYSADFTGCEEIKAAETGMTHYIRRIMINTVTAMNITLGSGESTGSVTTAHIGPIPVAAGNFCYAIAFRGKGMKITPGASFTIDTDAAGAITIYAEGKTCTTS